MSTIVTRAGKGSPLTNTELDSNFTNLNTDKLELSGGTLTGNLSLGDNVKAQFGTGNDLEIYHTNSQSYIEDAGTGNLNFKSNGNNFNFLDGSDNIVMQIDMNSETTLYHNTSAKLATTSTGADITGVLTADGLTSELGSDAQGKFSGWSPTGSTATHSGAIELGQNASYQGIISYDAANDTRFIFDNSWSGTASTFEFRTNTAATAKTHLKIEGTGDISFYEDTGTTPKMVWDASTEELQIGGNLLNLSGVTSGTTGARISGNGNGTLRLASGGVDALTIVDGGNATFSGSVTSTGLTVHSSSAPKITISNGGGTSPNPELEFFRQSGVTARITYEVANKDLVITNDFANGTTQFKHGSSEQMRLSGGNLLVGTTSTTPAFSTGTGINISPTGESMISSGNNTTLFLNRTSGSGSIMDFRLGGNQVGVIGTVNSNIYLGTGDTGIYFNANDDSIYPINTTTIAGRDNGVDLGKSDTRFKDLYLSGTANANKYAHDGDSDTYFNFPAANQLSLVAGGAEILRAYQIAGAYGVLKVNGSGSQTYPNFTFNGDDNTGMYRATTDTLAFTTGGQEAARIDASQNLLVGTTSNDGQSVGSSSQDGIVLAGVAQYIQRGDNANLWLSKPSGATNNEFIKFYHNSATVGSIGTQGGDLNIGTGACGIQFVDGVPALYPWTTTGNITRDAAIDLGDSGARFKDLYLSNNATAQKLTLTKDPVGTYSIEVDGTNTGQPNLIVKQSTSERFRCDNNGNLLVGKTSSSGSVAGSVHKQSGQIETTVDNTYATYWNRITSDGVISYFSRDGVVKGSISISGSSTSYNTSSDERLKDNIKDSNHSGSKVDAIQVRQFDWKADGTHQDYGMVAQELQSVAPEAVSVPEDSEEMMGVDYSKLVPMLIKEIQSLRQRVAQLEE